ncbi:type VI secretion system ImpA domain-containing protein [Pseudomonas sp. AP19]|uniref:type VI secretion system protein TssA n=1 Tax=Pseudomonas TaxID=286 RepID=UPI00084A79FE|nr:type VI secretion system protein TssA [Pseudomonas sp. AP19]OEC72513.1 type VI secretion system ImpA domain-containing protein [Pseudomonas sp. AP19]
MHGDQDQLGACPINEQYPAGHNPRDGDAFAAAQAEIDKLNNIHALEAVDWQRLSTLCEGILKSEGKDLSVAIWLLCAWTRLRAMAGLSAGVHLLREMLDLYWHTLTPPASRLRARRNQAQWLIEWLDKTLTEPFESLDAPAAERLISDWDAIEAFWRTQDDQAPSFARVRRRLEQLTRSQTQQPAPDSSSPAPQPALADLAIGAPPSVISPRLTALDDDEAIISNVETVFEALRPVQAYCLHQRPALPLTYRLNRQAIWITVEALPPSEGRNTRLPSPPLTLRESVLGLQQIAEPLDIARFCEGRLSSYPFWLDLNRISHTALLQAGACAAAQAVAHEVHGLVSRLPGVIELNFADGMPFADGATRAWLESLAPTTPVAAPKDAIEACVEDARRMANDGRLNEGLAELQRCIAQTASARDRFRLSASQCVLVYRFDPHPDLRIALEGLLARADELNLEQWEPELVKPLLEMMLEHSNSSEWSRRLSRLDLEGFWRKRSACAPTD